MEHFENVASEKFIESLGSVGEFELGYRSNPLNVRCRSFNPPFGPRHAKSYVQFLNKIHDEEPQWSVEIENRLMPFTEGTFSAEAEYKNGDELGLEDSYMSVSDYAPDNLTGERFAMIESGILEPGTAIIRGKGSREYKKAQRALTP